MSNLTFFANWLDDLGCDKTVRIESDENLQNSERFLSWLRDSVKETFPRECDSTRHVQSHYSVENVVKLIGSTRDLVGSVDIDARSISVRRVTKEYMDNEALFTRNLVLRLEEKNEDYQPCSMSENNDNTGSHSLHEAIEHVQIAADIELRKLEALNEFREKLPLLLESLDINSHRDNVVVRDVLDNDKRRLRTKIKSMRTELRDIKLGLKQGIQQSSSKPDYELIQLKIILTSLAEQRDRYIRVSNLISKEQAMVHDWKEKLDYALQTIDSIGPQFCREAYIFHKQINRN